MPAELAQLFGGAVGGALVSSILTPLIGERKQRREVRASVLQAVADIERTRWLSADLASYQESLKRFRSAALVAGADRRVVDLYARLAAVARRASDSDPAGDPEFSGGIPVGLADLVRDAAELVVDGQWHPHRQRLVVRRRIRRLGAKEQAVRMDRDAGSIDWTPPLLYR